MFHPLPLYVGLRYVRARSHKFFVSFITWVSVVGVCVGVAALIVILSVMNGFEGELRDRILALSSHARVTPAPDSPGNLASLAADISTVPGVAGAAPYVEVQALALHTPEMLPIVLRGIDPGLEGTVTEVARALKSGSLAALTPRSNQVILGSIVAQRLGIGPGDTVTLLVPSIGANGTPEPRLRQFTVAGLFEVGLQDHDGVLMLASLADVRAVLPQGSRAGAVHVRFDDALAAPARAAALRAALPPGTQVRDWTQDHANYFRAIRIEKTMMSLILMLIVAVAAFSIVAMLVMVVTDKRTDIAILRTFGTASHRVMGIFATQGLVIGWFGVLAGAALGVAIARNVTPIVALLERVFGFQIMDADVYYITRIPSIPEWRQIAWICGMAFLLTALATVYPALRAARVAPAEALRYE
ncbi:MAG TPA: lipoprotein-releasing ABC transporter permease subunit [Steroidobacteraceae bacterium]|nr:lipoprotein-releasing ABC transporter permease subunit [Steroidobacteraceae bacterium]HQX48178.1 lipoprotein-releasing ABC transporter permease subunit [Steroidobacteraceae bacterium]HQX77726.1 lipoprotein-releasing ABC transporter permease subunit [Steroidobacteraceae bacterium]HQZ79643.1 lipoprotein-releasing ABC transporter permease subunit [Steroidobacteraceae bacterium]